MNVLDQLVYAVSVSVTVGIPFWYFKRHRSKEKLAREKLQKAKSLGLTEPVSLHPKIDPNRCIATGACVQACPEGEILGLINGRAELVSPTRCIGHGACQAACPVDAIALVFGTERRGVEIPHVKETFETNVSGLYIAGELGGMGLIRNAVAQGKEAVEYISHTLSRRDPAVYDVAIVGAGPAGLAATLQAEKVHLRYITLDQDDIGGTVLTYPRQKLVMTQPMDLPLYGRCGFREIRKEELLGLWQDVIQTSGIEIHTHEKVENVERQNGYFRIVSARGEYLAQRVLLAIGRRGSPRKLGVPGERSSKVAYKLIEPEQYKRRKLLVVGGGDSAVEAALALGEQAGTEVTLSYRRGAFSRIKEQNRQRLERATEAGWLRVLYESNVLEIRPDSVVLQQRGSDIVLANDYVFVFIGGELPTAFLKKLGVQIEIKFGER